MQLKEHILYGGSVSIVLFPIIGIKTIFFFFASVLIDVDHYIDFLYFGKFKNWNVRKMFEFHHLGTQWRNNANFYILEAFHTSEFLLVLLVLSIYFNSLELFLIFTGMVFHILLDLIRLHKLGAMHVRALSFVEYWIRSKKMKQSGINPEKIFEEIYATMTEISATELQRGSADSLKPL